MPVSEIMKRKYATVPFSAIVFMAWRNIVYKKLRSFLTILGIIIGIGAIFFLLSISLGLQNLVTNELIGGKSIKSVDITSAKSDIITLNSEAAERIQRLPHVSKLGASFAAPGIVKYRGSESSGPVYGVDQNYQDLSNIQIIAGRKLEARDKRSTIISTAKLRSVGITKPEDILGKRINLSIPLAKTADGKAQSIEEQLQVVGVSESGTESVVFVPNFVFVSAGQTKFAQVKLLVDNLDNLDKLRRQIESIGFETTSPADTLDQINQIFKYFNLVLVGFGAVGMVVAILGMFNTLTISLLERTKEIGLMVALGSRRRDTRRIFVVEAVLLSLIGSVIGIALAISVGQITNFFMNRLARSRGVTESFQLFATPIWLVLALIAFMVLVGLGVVFFPARRAERINPIEALRRE